MTQCEKKHDLEKSLRLLVNSVKEYAIFMLDTGGYVMTWNEGAHRIKGYTAEEIVGQHFSIFYQDEAKERNHPEFELKQAIKHGSYEENGWRVRKDGTLFWACVVITPIYEDENLIGFAKVTRDLTEQVLQEQNQSQYKSEIAKMKERESLVLTLTHDMKNPLVGALRVLEVVDKGGEEVTLPRYYLALLRCGIQEVLSITRDLIDVFRQDLGQPLPSELEMVDLKELLDQAVQTQLASATMRKTSIEVRLPEEKTTVFWDIDSMTRVFNNLISNAIKFSPHNSRVDIHAFSTEKSIVIEFKDEGPGISDEELKSLFKPFSQGPIGTRCAGGSGLGLFSCKRLIEAHNGRVEYVKATSPGALFRIEMPRTCPVTSNAA